MVRKMTCQPHVLTSSIEHRSAITQYHPGALGQEHGQFPLTSPSELVAGSQTEHFGHNKWANLPVQC